MGRRRAVSSLCSCFIPSPIFGASAQTVRIVARRSDTQIAPAEARIVAPFTGKVRMHGAIRRNDDGLSALLQPARMTDVVDIGANPIDGDPPYKPMLQSGLCRVTGFDPHPQALAQLQARKGAFETYLPYAVGDGGNHVLNICRGIGFASLLQPEPK